MEASQIIQENQPCFIGNVVLSEVVWVLRGRPLQFAKDEIIATLEMILQSSGFEFEQKCFGAVPTKNTKKCLHCALGLAKTNNKADLHYKLATGFFSIC